MKENNPNTNVLVIVENGIIISFMITTTYSDNSKFEATYNREATGRYEERCVSVDKNGVPHAPKPLLLMGGPPRLLDSPNIYTPEQLVNKLKSNYDLNKIQFKVEGTGQGGGKLDETKMTQNKLQEMFKNMMALYEYKNVILPLEKLYNVTTPFNQQDKGKELK